ncbi:MAG: hypothetical protein LAP87_30845 [Acidobacteriia bacterium]|nr:hypothetical protein [Terriglobia bacterium]
MTGCFAAAMLVTLTGQLVRAQDQPPAPAGLVPAPPPVVLENTGPPMVLPFHCTADDIQWAGLSCLEDEPCAVYLELSAVEPAGGRIFAAGNIHTAAVTLYSVLLASEDEGRTWREVHERIRGTGLDHLQFLDAATGWASGVTLSPLPQDPFLVFTADGGKTWKRQDIFGDSAENHFGSIQQFYFSAKESGSLIVDRGQGSDGDRYALYESPNAGETWMIKQESTKPLRLKRPPAAPAEWRVRADGPTQSFRIERRQGERWTLVAAFAVKLAPCKPDVQP